MSDIIAIKNKIIKFTILCAFVLILLAFFLNRYDVAYGIVIGVLASILNFNILGWNIEKVINLNEKKAKIRGFIGYFIRYIIYAIALLTAIRFSQINLVATVLSIFILKLAIIILGILKKI